MARTTLQTAPADLQLLCANAVATQTGAASDKVLPVNSRQLDATSFQVELDAAGKRHSCVVDNDGNVKSVTERLASALRELPRPSPLSERPRSLPQISEIHLTK